MLTARHGSTSIGRRRFVQGSMAAASLGLLPRSLGAQVAGPWSARPAGNPASLTFVVWQYGKIYDQIGKQFEQDWNVKLNQIIDLFGHHGSSRKWHPRRRRPSAMACARRSWMRITGGPHPPFGSSL